MPWETDGSSKRRLELPPDWEAIRRQVGNRDRWTCQWPRDGRANGICGSGANQCDHRGDRMSFDPKDLWMLCPWHHRKKTEDESLQARIAILAKAKMPIRKHPGLL